MRVNQANTQARRRIRLPAYAYRQEAVALVTFCTRDRMPSLTLGALAPHLEESIRLSAADSKVDLLAWCVMPDHVHALVAPSHGGDLIAWVRTVKGRTAARARKLGIRNLWQRSFHDRFARSDEDLRIQAQYLLQNPVRAGLVDDWREWPHKGSLVWDLAEFDLAA